jgi:hypothetical protein
LLVGTGCGGSSSSGGTNGSGGSGVSGGTSLSSPVALEQATNAYVNALCTGHGTCCQSKGFTFDSATCVANLKAHPGADVTAMCAPPHVYDAQAVADCMADIQSAVSSCSTSSASACNRMCPGTVAPGASCTTAFDCAPSSQGTPICAGTCKIQVRDKTGDSCNQSCTQSSNGWLCEVSGTSSPTFDLQCFSNDGLYCGVDAICHALVAPGGACASTSACEAGYHCDSSTSTCVANAASGAACPQHIECSNDDYCDSNEICTAKKADGATCDTNSDANQCQGTCDSSTHQCVGSNGIIVTAQVCANPFSG